MLVRGKKCEILLVGSKNLYINQSGFYSCRGVFDLAIRSYFIAEPKRSVRFSMPRINEDGLARTTEAF